MLLETCIGDAYGAEFEFSEDKYVRKYNKGKRYYPEPVGTYTDDTQMTLAIAEALLEDDPWTEESLADRLVKVFKRDPRFGYSKRFFQLLTSVKNGKELLEQIEPTRDSCGCVIRTVPIGLIKDKNEMLEKVEIQARITHNPQIAIDASKAIALISHNLIYNDMKPYMIVGMLNQEIPSINWNKPWTGKVLNKAEDVAKAVVSILSDNNNYHDILVNSVALTGDVDSVASVAMGCASCSPYYGGKISEELFIIENLDYGGEYLIELDKKLQEKFGVKTFGRIIEG